MKITKHSKKKFKKILGDKKTSHVYGLANRDISKVIYSMKSSSRFQRHSSQNYEKTSHQIHRKTQKTQNRQSHPMQGKAEGILYLTSNYTANHNNTSRMIMAQK